MTRDEAIAQLAELQRRIDDVRIGAAEVISPRQRGFLWGAACDIRAVVRMLEMEGQLNDQK